MVFFAYLSLVLKIICCGKVIFYAPVICIPGSLGAGDSGHIAGTKCRELTFDGPRQCRRWAGVLISRQNTNLCNILTRGEAQPVHLHSLISSSFVA